MIHLFMYDIHLQKLVVYTGRCDIKKNLLLMNELRTHECRTLFSRSIIHLFVVLSLNQNTNKNRLKEYLKES